MLELLRDISVQYTMQYYCGVVIIFTLFWFALYHYLRRRQPNKSDEWHCRVVTAIHAMCCIIFSAVILVNEGRSPFYHQNQAKESTHGMLVVFSVSLSYFVFDLYWCCEHRSEGSIMYIHHVLCVVGYSVGILKRRYGLETVAALFGTELSNPLLQLRWFLRTIRQEAEAKTESSVSVGASMTMPLNSPMSSYQRQGLELVVDIMFMVVFGVMRILFGTPLIISFGTHPQVETIVAIGALMVYVIGVAFWIQICCYAWSKYLSTSRPKKTSHQTAKESPQEKQN